MSWSCSSGVVAGDRWLPCDGGSLKLIPSGPMLNWWMAGSWLLARVLMTARDRLMAP